MGSVVLDASVLVALMNTRDAHHEAARELIQAQKTPARFAIAASVYAELLVRATRLGTADRVDRVLARFDVEVVAVDRSIARKAAALRGARGAPAVKLPDALAAAVAFASTPPLPFLTFDKKLAMRYAAEARAT